MEMTTIGAAIYKDIEQNEYLNISRTQVGTLKLKQDKHYKQCQSIKLLSQFIKAKKHCTFKVTYAKVCIYLIRKNT